MYHPCCSACPIYTAYSLYTTFYTYVFLSCENLQNIGKTSWHLESNIVAKMWNRNYNTRSTLLNKIQIECVHLIGVLQCGPPWRVPLFVFFITIVCRAKLWSPHNYSAHNQNEVLNVMYWRVCSAQYSFFGIFNFRTLPSCVKRESGYFGPCCT